MTPMDGLFVVSSLVCFLFRVAVKAGDEENCPGSGEPYEKMPVGGCGDPEKWLMYFEFRIGVLGARFVDICASKLVGNLTRRAFNGDHMLIVGINACENWYNGNLCAFRSRLSDERFPQHCLLMQAIASHESCLRETSEQVHLIVNVSWMVVSSQTSLYKVNRPMKCQVNLL